MAAEKNFENKVKKYLSDHGYWYIKYWAGAQFTKEGIPDILACIDGKFFAIEIKAANGKPTIIQLVNLRKIRQAGGIGILLYPKDFEQFKAYIEKDLHTVDWYYKNIKMQEEWYQKLVK